jgi:hypothetical protein
MRCAPLFVTLLAACDGDLVQTDAPVVTHDTATMQTTCDIPIATTASGQIDLSGAIADSSLQDSANPLVGATVTAFDTGDAALGNATTESGGIYTVNANATTKPVGYLTVAMAGYKTTRFYPRAPIAITMSQTKIPAFTNADAAAFATMAGVTPAAGTAMTLVELVDCQGTKISGGTVTVMPAGSAIVKYFHGDGTTNGTSTDGAGLAVVFNLSSGSTTFVPQASGHTFYVRAVNVDSSYLAIDTISEM